MALPASDPIAVPDCTSIAAVPHCPRCDYVLAYIPEDRCPECGFGFSWNAAQRVEHFVGTTLVLEYRAVTTCGVLGLILAALPVVVPPLKRLPSSRAIAIAASLVLLLPTLIGFHQALRAIARDWAVPRWVWFGPQIGVALLLLLVFRPLLVLAGIVATGCGCLILLRTPDVPALLEPFDTPAGRRLAVWRFAAWTALGLGALVQFLMLDRLLA